MRLLVTLVVLAGCAIPETDYTPGVDGAPSDAEVDGGVEPLTIALFAGGGQCGGAGSTLAAPLVVTVEDRRSSPVENVSVDFVVTAGGGRVADSTIRTDALGRAQTTLTLGAALGSNTVEARATGLTGSPVVFTANAVAPVYAMNPAIYTKGQAITPNTPSSSSGCPASYAISPALPAGLAFSTETGAIAGTPTALSPATSYTVTATYGGGGATAILSITVNDLAPSGLTYSLNPATYFNGFPITPNIPSSSGGAVVSYAVTPDLPNGLGLDSRTGIVTGTPNGFYSTQDYTVTATNTGGSAVVRLTITVRQAPI